MNGADPVDFLLSPRVVAGIAATLVTAVFGAACMFIVGGFTATAAFAVPAHTYFSVKLVKRLDVLSFVSKCLVFGVVIPLVSARAGFAARGGSEGVGAATTRAVIECSLWILLFDLLIGGFFFFVGNATG
jgi:phospholipid/cholesterol/gamma-HCH transport system permease protein